MRIRLLTILAIVISSLMLTSCLEDWQVTIHDGTYQGPMDSLNPDQSALSERLEWQLDR